KHPRPTRKSPAGPGPGSAPAPPDRSAPTANVRARRAPPAACREPAPAHRRSRSPRHRAGSGRPLSQCDSPAAEGLRAPALPAESLAREKARSPRGWLRVTGYAVAARRDDPPEVDLSRARPGFGRGGSGRTPGGRVEEGRCRPWRSLLKTALLF